MCGRYYNRSEKQEIARRLKAGTVFADPLAPNFNIAPTTFQPVIRLERESDEREMVLLRWGLLPFFAKSPDEYKPFSTFNARTETILAALNADGSQKARPSVWREPIKKRRCLVPADGFYEWPESEKPPYKGSKHPRAFTLNNSEPMAFAGLWDAWKEPDGNWLQSFSIITTEANELLAEIHPRMPVILHPRDWEEWLSRDDSRPPPVHLLRPYDAEAMYATPCNPAVGNVRNNGPDMLACPAPDTLPLNSA
jgi:putative SOS response-associated peptidase YedK